MNNEIVKKNIEIGACFLEGLYKELGHELSKKSIEEIWREGDSFFVGFSFVVDDDSTLNSWGVPTKTYRLIEIKNGEVMSMSKKRYEGVSQ